MYAPTTNFERFITETLNARRVPDAGNIDYVGANGTDVFDVKVRRQGLRDVRDAILQMALYIGANRQITRGVVLISLVRSSPGRVLQEWSAAKAVLLPDIAQRLCLIAVVDGTIVVEPSTAEMQAIADQFRRALSRSLQPAGDLAPQAVEEVWQNAVPTRQLSISWRSLEVEKVLLHRWLLKEGPIGIGELQRRVGCSYPTVIHAIGAKISQGLIRRGTGGVVELAKYTRENWAALIAAAKQVYTSIEFVDVTGESGAADALAKRLAHYRDPNSILALGGVAAGRYWNPNFDLHGTPRVDLVARAPYVMGQARLGLGFVRQIDPALTAQTGVPRRSPVLVIHPIYRRDPLYNQVPGQSLPVADPVETILHLIELGLTAQAGALVARLRPEARFPIRTGEKE